MINTSRDNPRSDSDPIVLQQTIDGNEARFLLLVPDDLVYFKDHFPDQPILPGVVQIKWVTDLAARLPQPDAFQKNFSAMTKLKFTRLILPGNQLTLQLIASPSDKSLRFRFFNDRGDYASGQLNFK